MALALLKGSYKQPLKLLYPLDKSINFAANLPKIIVFI
ncbi:hypothetical protein HPHPP23_1302 [Helicobacter pylori Hp P-23]|nr:hypothetical protein HPHPP23_1302 [Helicobacter pylori Hp P-23]